MNYVSIVFDIIMNRRKFIKECCYYTACGLIGTTSFYSGEFIYSILDTEKKAYIKESPKNNLKYNNPKNKYALIITGEDTSKDCVDNTLKLVKKGLLNKGYSNMFFLGESQRSDSSSKENLKDLINKLSKKITKQDAFFLYILCHGSKQYEPLFFSSETSLKLDYEYISNEELSNIINPIESKYSIGYINSCYGGDIAKHFGDGNNSIGISPTKEGKVVSGGSLSVEDEKKYGSHVSYMSLYFFSAMAGKLPDGERINSPNNLEDLFDFAAIETDKKDRRLGSLFNNTPSLYSKNINPKNVYL